MKKKILALVLALLLTANMSLCAFAAVPDGAKGESSVQTQAKYENFNSRKNAISGFDDWQERMFTRIGFASQADRWNSPDKYFTEDEYAPESIVFWVVFMSDEVDKYVDGQGYYTSTYAQYMEIVNMYFVNPPDMSDYLIRRDQMHDSTQNVHFYMGGFGSDWNWVVTESYYEGCNDVWRIRGIFCDGWLDDTTGLTEYVDYYDNFKIDSAVELTVREDDEYGYRIASYNKMDYYCVNNENECTVYKYNEETNNFSDIYYPINVCWYDGQSVWLEEGTYFDTGEFWCCQAGKEVRWYSEYSEGYIPRVKVTRTEQGNTVTSIEGANGSVIGGPGIELRAVPLCPFKIDSPNAAIEAVQGLEALENGDYASSSPTPVELKITANEGYKVTGVEAKEQSSFGDFAVGTYDSETGTWKFYLEFMPDTIVVSTEEISNETVTVVSGADSAENVTVQIPAQDADKVEGLTLIANEVEPADKENDTNLIMDQLDVEKDDIYILDIRFENADGEEVKVNTSMVATLPIPEGWDPANTAVYYVNTETKEMIDMNAVVSEDGKTVSIATNHFSHYALVQREAAGDITASFPDENFRAYVSENFDKDSNGSLSDDEIKAVTKIDVSNKEIADLTGINCFTALEELYCCNNALTVLDLNKVLNFVYAVNQHSDAKVKNVGGKQTVNLAEIIGEENLNKITLEPGQNWEYDSATGAAAYLGMGVPKTLTYIYRGANLQSGINVTLNLTQDKIIIMKKEQTQAYIDGVLKPTTDYGNGIMAKAMSKPEGYVLPLRFIGEKFGMTVEYLGSGQTRITNIDGTSVVVNRDSTLIKKYNPDGTFRKDIESPVATFTEDGITYVPLRAVSEALGLGVRYQSTAHGSYVVISTDANIDSNLERVTAEIEKAYALGL